MQTLSLKMDFPSLFFSLDDPFWCLVSLLPKTQANFRDEIQTKFRQISDRNTLKQGENMKQGENREKNQTNFRHTNSDKNSDNFQTKVQTIKKIRQRFGDKVQTEIRVKFRHKSDRMPGLGVLLGVKFPGPFLAGNCAEKPRLQVLIWRGVSEDFRRNGGKIAENRALTDVNRP